MKRFLTLICTFIILFVNASAQDFSKYRVPVYNSIEEYQQNLIGRTFTYIPPVKDGKIVDVNSMGTKSYPVTITSIRGKKKKTKADEMRWKLTSEYSDRHELVIYIGHEDTWWSDEFENTDVPLYNLEDWIKEWKQDFIGTTFSHPKDNNTYTVIDVKLDKIITPNRISATYTIKNNNTGGMQEVTTENFENIKDLGNIVSHPNSKVSYTITNIDLVLDTLGRNIGNIYILKNNTTGVNKKIVAKNIKDMQNQLFKDLFKGKYEASLIKVEKPDNPNLRYGKTIIIDKDSVGMTRYGYKDSQVDIAIWVSHDKINFIIKNISDKTQKLIWDEAVFVDMYGTTSKVAHYGTKYSQMEESQPASVIIKGAKLEDVAYPTNKIKYDDIVMKDWIHEPIFPYNHTTDKLPSIRLMLPILIKDVVNEYTFEFGINWVHTNPDYKPTRE